MLQKKGQYSIDQSFGTRKVLLIEKASLEKKRELSNPS